MVNVHDGATSHNAFFDRDWRCRFATHDLPEAGEEARGVMGFVAVVSWEYLFRSKDIFRGSSSVDVKAGWGAHVVWCVSVG